MSHSSSKGPIGHLFNAIGQGIKYTGKAVGETVSLSTGAVTDTFNKHVDTVPEYSRRLEMKFPIELNGNKYETFGDALQPLKDMITEATGVEFQGDVTTDANIAIHPEHLGPNWIKSDSAEPRYVELHFSNADTLNNFVKNAGLSVNQKDDEISWEGNDVNPEGNADATTFDFFKF